LGGGVHRVIIRKAVERRLLEARVGFYGERASAVGRSDTIRVK